MRVKGREEGLRVSLKVVIAVIVFQRKRREIFGWRFDMNGRVEMHLLVMGLNRNSFVIMASNG